MRTLLGKLDCKTLDGIDDTVYRESQDHLHAQQLKAHFRLAHNHPLRHVALKNLARGVLEVAEDPERLAEVTRFIAADQSMADNRVTLTAMAGDFERTAGCV